MKTNDKAVLPKKNGELTWEKNPSTLLPEDRQRIVWVDLQSSTEEEKRLVESLFNIELFTPQEAAEIESSSSLIFLWYFKRKKWL